MKYYFYTGQTFTEKVCATPEEAIKHAQETDGVIKVVASKGSKVIWTKESK